MDHRLKRMSYSSSLLLHSCPRKYQLYKLNSQAEAVDDGGWSSVTFAFGTTVGVGVQEVMLGTPIEEVIWKMFLAWDADLEGRDSKRNKNFYKAVAAVQKFVAVGKNGLLKDYELVHYNDKPAVELSFCIRFPDGFIYRGFVDAVLRHKYTGEIMVLECKTNSKDILNPAEYKNSSQAIGYSIVLDALFSDLSSYKVLYLIYKTKSMEYEAMSFVKSYLQRALWIQELLLDVEMIKMYENVQVYPMHGESCFHFYRECEYLNLCQLSTEHLTTPEPEENPEEFQINISIADLISAQFAKGK